MNVSGISMKIYDLALIWSAFKLVCELVWPVCRCQSWKHFWICWEIEDVSWPVWLTLPVFCCADHLDTDHLGQPSWCPREEVLSGGWCSPAHGSSLLRLSDSTQEPNKYVAPDCPWSSAGQTEEGGVGEGPEREVWGRRGWKLRLGPDQRRWVRRWSHLCPLEGALVSWRRAAEEVKSWLTVQGCRELNLTWSQE